MSSGNVKRVNSECRMDMKREHGVRTEGTFWRDGGPRAMAINDTQHIAIIRACREARVKVGYDFEDKADRRAKVFAKADSVYAKHMASTQRQAEQKLAKAEEVERSWLGSATRFVFEEAPSAIVSWFTSSEVALACHED